jgi:hypothetical protein
LCVSGEALAVEAVRTGKERIDLESLSNLRVSPQLPSWEISLTPRPPHSLPVALRPYPDEGLASWLSRTGAIYGCTAGELISQFVEAEREPFDEIDLKPSCNVLSPLGDLLSTTVSDLEKCTIAQAHPEWLIRWIGRTQPLWHVADHRTFDRSTVIPAVCPLCLSDDLRAGHSQYLRLAWYCSILTICPLHRTPMVSCCSAEVWHRSFATHADMLMHRWCCLRCCRHFDCPQNWGTHVDQHAISALLFFESTLRGAISQRWEADVSAYDSMVLVEPIQDLAWQLMQPLSWSSLRALHFLQTPQFKGPLGLNTPVESSNWLGTDWLAPKPLDGDRQFDPAPLQCAELLYRMPEEDCPSRPSCAPATAPRTGVNSVREP